MLSGLVHTLDPGIAIGRELRRVWISSARDSHSEPSRHVTGQAIDISRVNGKYVHQYLKDAEIRAFVDALQARFESFNARRENFGPCFLKKEGKPFPSAPPHGDHIHFSVN